MSTKSKSEAMNELANRCAGIARTLTYNEEPQGTIKHTLRECSHFIDCNNVRLIRNRDGVILRNGRGKERYATLRERVAIWLLRGRTEVRP